MGSDFGGAKVKFITPADLDKCIESNLAKVKQLKKESMLLKEDIKGMRRLKAKMIQTEDPTEH